MTVSYTPLRHRMLAEIGAEFSVDSPYLDCVNRKRSIWKPRRGSRQQFGEFSAAESRAVGEMTFDLIDTPHWQGDMDVHRVLRLTDAGRELLALWSAEHGDPLAGEAS